MRPAIPLLALAVGLAGCTAAEPPVTASDPVGFTFESTATGLASFGWSGAVHQITGPSGTPFGVTTTKCQDGVCSFVGPTDPRGKVNRHRCLFRTSVTCTADSDCPLDGGKSTPCVYIYDAPITQGLVGVNQKVGACAWSYIPVGTADDPTIAGTINLASGAVDLRRLSVFLPLNGDGAGSFFGACGECVDDPIPNDGIRGGTCQASKKLGDPATAARPDDQRERGMPCDVNRSGTSPGFEGNYSMDCSPTVLRSPLPPLAFGGSFSSKGMQISLSDDSPACSNGGKCFCGTCKGTTQACMVNKECGDVPCVNPSEAECGPVPPGDSNGVPHQCGKDPTKFPVYANGCIAGACNWNDATGKGTCKRPGDEKIIACYPSSGGIVVAGHEERDDHVGTVYRVSTGAASCIPLAQGAPLNMQLGLPGLLFQKRDFQIIPVYAEDKP